MYDKLFRILSFTLVFLTTQWVWPDTLQLANGDRLTGSLINIRSGLLSFRTELAGRIFVPTEEVTGLNTVEFMLVSMNNDTALPGKIVTQDEIIYVINPSEDTKTLLALNDVSSIQSVPQSPTAPDSSHSEKSLAISLEPGYQWRDGNESNQGITTNLKIESQTDRLKLNADLSVELTEDGDHLDHFIKGEIEAQVASDSEIKPTVLVNLERNTDKTIEYRSDIAIGGQKNLINKENQQLDGFVGIEATVEKFDSDTLRREQNMGPTSESSRHDEDLNLNMLLKYNRRIYGSSTIMEKLTLHPSLTNPSDIRAEFESILQVPLPLGMKLRLNVEIEYDDTLPYANLDDWSTRFGASVKIEF
jgi:hypothetical protein